MSRRTPQIALGATLTLIGSMIALPGAAMAAPSDPVLIPDTALRDAVKAAVGHQPDNTDDPTEGEMATIGTLDLSNLGVGSLEGIEYATSLSNLFLSGNSVSDITPLASLPVLSNLDLSLNPVSTLAPLTGKSSLSFLDLTGISTDEAAAEAVFASLSNLDALDVSSSGLGEEAAAAVSVQELIIDDNMMTDLDGYEALTNLKALYASGNPFEDISALQDIDLDYLGTGVTRLRDISGISADYGQVLTEVASPSAVGAPVDVEILGTEGSPVAMTFTGEPTYDALAGTASWASAGDYQASWSEESGDAFVFSGNINVEVESSGPAAVPDFTASGRIGEAVLRWTEPNTNGTGDIEEYMLRWSDDLFVTEHSLAFDAGTTSHVLEGLAAGDWHVELYYTTEYGATSPVVFDTFKVLAHSYSAPTDLDGEYLPANQMNVFSWDGEASSYIVSITDDSGRVYKHIALGNELSVPSSEFADPSRFIFSVEAGDDEGSLGASSAPVVFNPVTGYVGPVTVSAPVTDLQVENDQGDATATVTFSRPSEAEVVKYVVTGGDNDVVAEGVVTGASFTFPTVSNEQYTVVVSSRSESSEYASATVSLETEGLPSVTGLTGTLGAGHVVLDWDAIGNADRYEVVILPETASTPTTVEVTNPTATVNWADFPDGNEQFEIAVRAIDAGGARGGYSTVLLVNPGAQYVGPATAMLPAPTNLLSVYNEADNTFTFTWDDDDIAQRFLVTMNGMQFFSPTNSITLPAGAAGTVYDVVVAQRSATGPYGPGAAIEVMTPEDVPVVPGELTATVQGDDVLASWTPIAGAVQYLISVGQVDANGGSSFPTDETSELFIDGNLRSFILTVTGLDENGDALPGVYQGVYNAGSGEFLDLTAPPASVEVGQVQADGTNVTVSWESVSQMMARAAGADMYRVTATNGTEYMTSGNLPANATSFSWPRSAFAPGSTWTFSVQARFLSSGWNAAAEAALAFPADGGDNSGPGGDNSGPGGDNTPGAGGGDAAPGTGAGTATDPIKASGGSDLSLAAGALLALLGAGLLTAPLIRRKKGLAEPDAA